MLTTTLMVNSLLDDGTAGTLRAAIGEASSGADSEYIIQFGPALTGTITLTQGQLSLANSNAAVAAKAITIDGPGASQLAVSGTNASRVFEIMSGMAATLAGLTITGNQVRSSSGIFNNRGATLMVTNSTISRNSDGGILNNEGMVTVTHSTLSGNSGGITNNKGTLTVINSTLSGNSGRQGEGGGIWNTGTLTVTSTTISGNTVSNRGAGIYNLFGGTATVTGSTISDNYAIHYGGGIWNAGLLTITDSTISSNSASVVGGGIYSLGFGNIGDSVTVTNSILSGNSATYFGGGIYIAQGVKATVTNSTLSGNTATRNGGGIFNNSVAMVELSNTIVAGNQGPSGPDLYGVASSQGHNLIGDTSDSSGWGTSDLTDTAAAPLDPLLGPLQDNGGPTQTMALLPGSPAFDAGTTVPGLTTDQRGIARPQGSAPDIGAFESRGFVLAIVSGGNQATSVGQSFGQPLVVSVSSPFDEPVDGGVVGFTAPGSGASTAPPTGSAAIFQGKASFLAVANTLDGSFFVMASASGASQSGSFRLTNMVGGPVPVQIITTGGTPQTATVVTDFTRLLEILVTDQYGNPMPGVAVIFAAPGTGAGALFGAAATLTATTDAAGLARASATANSVSGSYTVTASVAGIVTPATFILTNTPGAPARVIATGGTSQTATVVTNFTQPLEVVIIDQYGNPVPGVAASFATPGSGPGASFGGWATFTATTDAAGLATALATANTEAGQYVVTASVAGVPTPAAFALTNVPAIVPRVVGQQRFGRRRRLNRLVLSFSEGLDPARASDSHNYALFDAGRDGRVGTRDDRRLGLGRVVYDPAGPIVTLRPRRPLNLNRRYTLVVRGTPPGGLADPAGGFLAGDGRPGTDYVTTFGREILSRPEFAKRPGRPRAIQGGGAISRS